MAITGGAGVLIGGGIEIYRSYRDEGRINWKRVGKGAIIGGAIGVGAGAGSSLIASTAMAGTSLTMNASQTYQGFYSLVKGGTAATAWGVSRDGVNQGIKHFFHYPSKRIMSIAKSLGIDPTNFSATKEGFNNFTNASKNIVNNYAKIGGQMRDLGNNKFAYYYNKVIVIVKDGKLQTTMKGSSKYFEKMK